jgi:hypothetical protein
MFALPVGHEGRPLGVAELAEVADVGLDAPVGEGVDAHRRAKGKGLAALGADVGPLTSVDARVFLQVVLAGEPLAAEVAGEALEPGAEGPGPSPPGTHEGRLVARQMLAQRLPGHEELVTVSAAPGNLQALGSRSSMHSYLWSASVPPLGPSRPRARLEAKAFVPRFVQRFALLGHYSYRHCSYQARVRRRARGFRS